MKFRLGGLNTTINDTDTPGLTLSVFFQGCSRHCYNCHNPELWDHDGGREADTDEIISRVKNNRDWYDSVALMGGEPLEQPEALRDLLKKLNELDIEVWLYTGFDYEEIPEDIVRLCDVIIAGAYVDELKTNSFPASSNQQVIDRRR